MEHIRTRASAHKPHLKSHLLTWRRDGTGWVLLAGRRSFGRVVADSKYPGMWRSTLSGGRLSDMANLA
jgi:hypothetical protein